MALKTFRPTSPGRRGMVKISFDDITKTEPEKSLLVPAEKESGKEQQGRYNNAPQGRRR